MFFEDSGSSMDAKSKKIWPSWLCCFQVGLSWTILAASWVVLGDVGSKIERNGATRSAKESQDGAQEAAKCCQDGDLGSFWDHFLMIWDAFWLTGSKSKNRSHFGSSVVDIKRCRYVISWGNVCLFACTSTKKLSMQ